MGLFSSKKICAVCNIETGKIEIKNGYVCKKCIKNCGDYLSSNIKIEERHSNEIKKAIEKNQVNKDKLHNFKTTKKIANSIEVDEEDREWLVLDSFGKRKENTIVYKYEDIRGFELIEDEKMLMKCGFNKSTEGKPVGCRDSAFIRSVIIRIHLEDRSTIDIELVATDLNIHSMLYDATYKSIRSIVSFLESIISNEEETEKNALEGEISVVDQLINLEGLLDLGTISKDEFEKIKSRLLGF